MISLTFISRCLHYIKYPTVRFHKRKLYKFIYLAITSVLVFTFFSLIGLVEQHDIARTEKFQSRASFVNNPNGKLAPPVGEFGRRALWNPNSTYSDRGGRKGNHHKRGNHPLFSRKFPEIQARLEALHKNVLDVCKQSNYSGIPSVNHEWQPFAFKRLSLCSIPKSGTTFLRRTLKPSLYKTGYRKIPFPEEKRKRFMIVREPYSRLVSAFFSKMVAHPGWWFATKHIISLLRRNASDISLRCGHDITFPEFVKFVLDIHRTHEYRDPHFLRIMEVCNVCFDTPDYIGKLENIEEDMIFILNTVNVTGMTDKKFNEVRHLAILFMSHKEKFKDCGPMCPILQRFWWGQQATGLISFDIDLPLKGKQCEHVTKSRLADIAWRAHQQSVGRINKPELKRKVMTDLFRQVPIEDRNELKRLYSIECELFGYDPEPAFVFPELSA